MELQAVPLLKRSLLLDQTSGAERSHDQNVLERARTSENIGLCQAAARHVADHWRGHVGCALAVHGHHYTFACSSRLHMFHDMHQRHAVWELVEKECSSLAVAVDVRSADHKNAAKTETGDD